MSLGRIMFIHGGEGTSWSPTCADGQNVYRGRWDVVPCRGRKDFHGLQRMLENLVFLQEIINSNKLEARKL